MWGNGLLLALVLVLGYYFFFAKMAAVKLDVTTDNRTVFKIYYKGTTGGWSEKKTSAVVIQPGKTSYSLRLTDISKVTDLRIDTSEKPATVTVRSLVVDQHGYAPLRIASKKEFEKLQPGSGIADFKVGEGGVTVIPSGQDPQLFFTLETLQKRDTQQEDAVRALVIVLVSFLLVFLLHDVFTQYTFAAAMVLVAFTLVGTMAVVSLYNVHPDEAVHVGAARYYQDHSLPPRVGDPDILHTYSKYGVSRLHTGEIVYWIAGKFGWFLQPLQLPAYLSFRLFNVTLFAFLVMLAAKSINCRIILLPLLLSSQVWYIFSYFNSDAFGLFIILLVSYQVAVRHSLWNRLLAGTLSPVTAAVGVAGLGILLGMLLLLKKNFYFFALFLFFYFLWRLFFGKSKLTMQALFSVLSVILVGGTMYGAVRMVDSAVNDHIKSEKVLEARELYAEKMFKPSTPLDQKYAYLQMKDRGVSLKKIVQNDRWGERLFRSSFGEYGYMTVAASFSYYNVVRYAGLAFLVVASAAIIIRGGWQGRSLLAITLANGLMLMAMILYHCWTVDFQAQGRYLLPTIGMLSVLTFHMRKALSNPPVLLLFCVMYGLSVYSFVFVGLAGLGKCVYALG